VLKVGDIAPEIDATTTRGEKFVLSEQKAICTVIYFYPKAFTPGCTRETRAFAENHNEIMLAGAGIVGISTDDGSTQCDFAKAMGVPFPLIGDDDKRISRGFGVLWPLFGVAKRVTFVVGAERRIIALYHHELNVGQHRDDVLRFVHDYCDAVRAQAQSLWQTTQRTPRSEK
jgi:peroxiredoxin